MICGGRISSTFSLDADHWTLLLTNALSSIGNEVGGIRWRFAKSPAIGSRTGNALSLNHRISALFALLVDVDDRPGAVQSGG
jgi:hypothetical protein